LSDGHNIYHWISQVKNDSLALAQQLFSLGVEYHENTLKSPFDLAVRNGEFQMADFFLKRCGADIDLKKVMAMRSIVLEKLYSSQPAPLSLAVF
jgi:hypothetical protein